MKANRIISLILAVIMAASVILAGGTVTAEEQLYKDVKTSRWSYADIKYVTENGLMNGKSEGVFAPSETMTRAMVVTVLYRLQGEPEMDFETVFTDVKKGTWYTDAVLWAAQKGIVEGVGNDKYAPMDTVTREQLATIIMRYAPIEYIITDDAADITGYADYKKVHEYARDALSWANAVGLITGKTEDTLAPREGATREQFAAILRRFKEYDSYKYKLIYNEPTAHSIYTEKEYPPVNDADIYVAVDGNDANPGTLDKPIATFARAKEMVRELKKTATDEIKVAFKAGNYGALDNLQFTAEDSGTAEVPITYCAYGDGEVVFSNGYTLPNADFKPIDDSDKYLFTEKNYDSIYKIDVSDILPEGVEITTLFSGNGICHEARYPNKNSDGTDRYYTNMTTTVDKYCSIQLQALLPKVVEGFRTTEGMRATGFFRVGWLVETFNVKSYDPETKVLTFDTYEGFIPPSGYPIGESAGGWDFMFEGRTDDTIFFSNLSDQLDNDGEFWFDPSTKTLYVYKPNGDYTIATGGAFMDITNADNLSFVGLTFNGSIADIAITASNSESLTFDRCTFCNASGDQVMNISFCLNFKFINCEMFNFGATGIYLTPFWKDRINDFENSYQALNESGVLIDNNYFHDFGFVDMWSGAINIYCSYGTKVSHNYFKNGAHAAVEYNSAINTFIEYNVFDNMMMTTADYGAIYTYWGFEDRDNVVRYNLFKNIRSAGAQYAIYLDGDANSTEIYGNLFYEAGTCGVTITGGRDHKIHDNVYVDVKSPDLRRFLFSKFNLVTEAYLEEGTPYKPGTAAEIKRLQSKLPKEGEPGYEMWVERWPLLYQYHDDISKLGDVECIFTTVNYVEDNYLIGDGPIEEKAFLRFGVGLETNKLLTLEENPFFKDPTHGDYSIVDGADFELPVAQMGRY